MAASGPGPGPRATAVGSGLVWAAAWLVRSSALAFASAWSSRGLGDTEQPPGPASLGRPPQAAICQGGGSELTPTCPPACPARCLQRPGAPRPGQRPAVADRVVSGRGRGDGMQGRRDSQCLAVPRERWGSQHHPQSGPRKESFLINRGGLPTPTQALGPTEDKSLACHSRHPRAIGGWAEAASPPRGAQSSCPASALTPRCGCA